MQPKPFPTSWLISMAMMSALIFVLPIPGTIALRNSLAFFLLVTLCYSSWKMPATMKLCNLSALKWPLSLLAILTGWITLVIVGWSVEPALSWKEFWAQWILPLLYGMSGLLLAQQAESNGYPGRGVKMILKLIFYTLFFQVALHCTLDAIYLISTGAQPFRQAPVLYLPLFIKVWQSSGTWTEAFTGQYFEKFSFINNTFAAILIAEILQRTIEKRRWLDLPNWLLVISFVLVLLCSYWLRVRNGNLGLVFLIVAAGLLTLVRIRHRFKMRNLLLVFSLGLACMMSMGYAFWKTDARWQTFVETVPIALDTDTNKAWLSASITPYPRLANGSEVDPSNYERIAWIKEGLKLGWENPLGTGLNRNAFFDGLDRKYQMNGAIRGGHSHNGVVDFFIANGLPGLLLWFAFLFSLTVLGWKTFASSNMALGLMLIFLISGFFSRSLLDSNIRDHVLQQFFFIVAIFSSLCASSCEHKKSCLL